MRAHTHTHTSIPDAHRHASLTMTTKSLLFNIFFYIIYSGAGELAPWAEGSCCQPEFDPRSYMVEVEDQLHRLSSHRSKCT